MIFQFSAGGVVYKKDPELRILVSQHSQHHGWVFPKGLIGDKEENKKEGKEETAIREVKEETGVDGEIEKPLTPVTFWFEWEGDPSTGHSTLRDEPSGSDSKSSGRVKVKKTVYYFIMKFVGGDITQHDHEMEAVEWIKPSEVEKRLTYPSDKKVWREARKVLGIDN